MKRFIWLEECKRFSATNQDVGRFLTSLKWYREHAEEVQAALEQLKINLLVPSDWEVRISKLPKLPRLRMQIFNLHMPETDDKRAKLFLELILCEIASTMIKEHNFRIVDDLERLPDCELAQKVSETPFKSSEVMLSLAKILIRNYLFFMVRDTELLEQGQIKLAEAQFLRLASIPAMTLINQNLIKRVCENVKI